ncbi:hypothetical protein BDQ12DRAFT_739541 [Crucibulum laeve]|uniref:Uncharacterized protein n=1 Tax=Crucibulum laeve TaxID=68775 RepID=A0A5C3LHM0_9AGAR|nr:hypothetical protein BDQ12DRAFT_739541 [Crucibulum laeve]
MRALAALKLRVEPPALALIAGVVGVGAGVEVAIGVLATVASKVQAVPHHLFALAYAPLCTFALHVNDFLLICSVSFCHNVFTLRNTVLVADGYCKEDVVLHANKHALGYSIARPSYPLALIHPKNSTPDLPQTLTLDCHPSHHNIKSHLDSFHGLSSPVYSFLGVGFAEAPQAYLSGLRTQANAANVQDVQRLR